MRYSVRSALVAGRDDVSFLMDSDHLAVIHNKELSGNAIKLYQVYLGIIPGVLIDDDFVASIMSVTKPTLMKLRNELKNAGLLYKERKANSLGQCFVYLAPAKTKTLDEVIKFWESQDAYYLDFLRGVNNGFTQ